MIRPFIEFIESAGYVVKENGGICNSKGVVKKKFFNKKTGYFMMGFSVGKKYYSKTVHRIIAEKFIPNPDNKPCVNHKNGVKTDNRIENLEWCTYSENMFHAHENDLMVNCEIAASKAAKRVCHVAHKARRKKVIDNNTGKIYDSAVNAANELKINYVTLITKLSGNCKNNTGLRYFTN